MKKSLFFLLLFSLTALIFIPGCRKISNINSLELGQTQPEFAIPLFKTKANINDALANLNDDTFITYDEDGLIILNYKGSVLSRSTQDIFDVIANGGFPVEDTLVNYYFDLPQSIDLNYANLSSGQIFYLFNSYHEQDVEVTMTFPQLLDNGEPFTINHHVNYTGTTPVQGIGFHDVEGYQFISNNNDTITFRYEAILADGTRDTLSDFAIGMQEFRFSYIEGYLGEDIYELPRDTIFIDFFKDWTQGDIYFQEPFIKINVANSFGFPVRSAVEFINVLTVNGELLELESEYVDSINVDFPSLDEVGETKYTEFVFSHENSNIAEILGSGPLAVDYLLNAKPNPNSSGISGFATDSSVFAVQVEVELPFYGSADNFLAFDTVAVDTFDLTSDFSAVDDIVRAEFKLITENSLPLGIELQVGFADENGSVLDYLFESQEQFVEAAPVDANGDVTEAVEKIFFIEMSKTRFDKLRDTRQLFLRSAFSTSEGSDLPVRVKGGQEIGIRMGVTFVYSN